MSKQNRLDQNAFRERFYRYFSMIAVTIIAILFAFPLYWIITGAFKTGREINSTTPVWFPSEWDLGNFERLMSKRSAPLFEFFGIVGPTVPGALRWLLNTVLISHRMAAGTLGPVMV